MNVRETGPPLSKQGAGLSTAQHESYSYDVIVVGAGPAGNIAADRLSKLGYKLVVLDWRDRPGDKLCTGIIGRECTERYPPDDEDVLRAVQSVTVVAPSGRAYRILKGEPQSVRDQ